MKRIRCKFILNEKTFARLLGISIRKEIRTASHQSYLLLGLQDD